MVSYVSGVYGALIPNISKMFVCVQHDTFVLGNRLNSAR